MPPQKDYFWESLIHLGVRNKAYEFDFDPWQMTLIRCSSITCTHIPNMSSVAWSNREMYGFYIKFWTDSHKDRHW